MFNEILFIAVLVFLYFIPTVVAVNRDHRNAGAIMMLNLLLGWSGLGWIAALIWSMTNSNDNVRGDRAVADG